MHSAFSRHVGLQSELPVHIGINQKQGHERVHRWTMACLVLHNLLHSMRDDESWLKAEIEREEAVSQPPIGGP